MLFWKGRKELASVHTQAEDSHSLALFFSLLTFTLTRSFDNRTQLLPPLVSVWDSSGHLSRPMPRSHLDWCYWVYAPTLKVATEAYKDSPGSSDKRLERFKATLEAAWRIKDFPDMEIPCESVKELRTSIIKGLNELKEALIADKDKAPVPDERQPCTVILVSAPGVLVTTPLQLTSNPEPAPLSKLGKSV